MATKKPCNCSNTSTLVSSHYSVATTTVAQTTSAAMATCPECSSLESLCRPRFFDGQLLSADDLNRLERYIVQKNRLHNRTLHGWGVVCGLEVVCDSCKDQVIVHQGYALSPCGDDIVVSNNVSVPVCDLIKQSRNTAAYNDCYSGLLTAEERGCEEALEDWNLFLCYDEKPVRGITSLRASSSASSGCSCQQQSTSTSKTTTARISPQCEPSVTCEGFHFTVSKATRSTEKRKLLGGAMIDRFLECYRELSSVLPEFSMDLTQVEEVRKFCCDLKGILKEFLLTHNTYSCQLDEALAQIVCPAARQPANETERQEYLIAILEAFIAEVLVIVEYLRYCLCTIFLPPCPEPVTNNCVPIATIRIRRTDCKILSVCNVTNRRFAVSIPSLAYWLSWVPLDQYLRPLLAKICCGSLLDLDLEFKAGEVDLTRNASRAKEVRMKTAPEESTAQQPRPEAEVKSANVNRDLASILAQAWTRGTDRLDLSTMILDAMGASKLNGQSFLTAEERRNPLTALLANQIAMPMAESILPQDVMNITNVNDLRKIIIGETPPATPVDLEALKTEVSRLNSVVTKQQKTINTLNKKVSAAKKG